MSTRGHSRRFLAGPGLSGYGGYLGSTGPAILPVEGKVPQSALFKQLLAQQIILRGCARGLSIVPQVLDGPPGFTARRLSSFLLIPVGIAGRDLQFWGGVCLRWLGRLSPRFIPAHVLENDEIRLICNSDGSALPLPRLWGRAGVGASPQAYWMIDFPHPPRSGAQLRCRARRPPPQAGEVSEPPTDRFNLTSSLPASGSR
jgi:hypothetical protein